MFNRVIKCLFVILIAVFNASVLAETQLKADVFHSPFAVKAELPISIGSGLPIALSAELPAKGVTRFGINGVIKSNANDSGSDNEILILDGETHSIEFSLEHGLSEKWAIDLQVAYIRHTSGSLDGLIQDWHDAFGLSDGDRPFFSEDQLNFDYQNDSKNSAVRRNIDQPTGGISDIRIGTTYLLNDLSNSLSLVDHLSLRSGLSLPTGNSDKLTGSDKLDWDIGLYASGRSKRWQSLGWHSNTGFLYTGDDSLFGIKTQQGAWFNSLGFSWSASNAWQIKAQIDSHSALFDSEVYELERFASQLTLGATFRNKHFGFVDVYFSEDLTVNRAADFGFGLNVRFAL